MGSRKIQIDQLAEAVNEQMEEYSKLSAEVVKAAVTKAGNAVKKDIGANAPKKTGRFAKSWRTKKTKESSTELEVTVYSPTRYMLAHLLEHGHAKRGGGRKPARFRRLLRKKNPARHMPDGIVSLDACLNDVLNIASAVKDTDDADLSFIVINQIINGEIIDRKKAHPHGSPWFPFDGCVSFGKEVKGADGFTYPVHLSLGVLWSELLESNIGIDGSQVIERFRGIDDLICHMPKSFWSMASTSSAE